MVFVDQFKNVDFEDNGILVDFEPTHQPHKPFLLRKPTEHFLLMVRDNDDALPFRVKDFFIPFDDISGIFGFIHFLGSFVQLFHFSCVLVHKRIYQLLLCFFLVESLRLLDVFLNFSTKNKKKTIYHKSKTSFTNKNTILLSLKHVLLGMIKGCKSTLPQAFLQNCFSDQPYQ